MATELYYEGPRWPGMNAWRLKALYKVGMAGRRGRSAKLSPGTVRDYLIRNRFIMKLERGRYMLTAFGQVVFKTIKKRKKI